MKILILAPTDKSFIKDFLKEPEDQLPLGAPGAPFLGAIIKELLANNHEVIALTTTPALNNDYSIKKFSNSSFKWVVVPSRPKSIRFNGSKPGRIIDLFKYERKRTIEQIKIIKPDFIHAHWSYDYAWSALSSKKPCLVTVHDNANIVLKNFKNVYRFGRLLMANYVLNNAKFVSTVSPYMLPYVEKKCKNVKIIPNPIDIKFNLKDIEALITQRIASISAPKIVMINNGWDQRKNGLAGLMAFKDILKVFPEATLHLYGNGSEKSGRASEDAEKLGLTNINFHGLVPNAILKNALKTYHLLIHPALEESFGVVLIEAMSMGIPTIGGKHSGAVPYVIDNDKLLVDVNTPEDISNCAIDLLSNQDNYKSIGISSFHNTTSRFSAKKVVKQYEDYYKFILTNWS
jgi:glycosyltransferase involved in cell wall biosynthesis